MDMKKRKDVSRKKANAFKRAFAKLSVPLSVVALCGAAQSCRGYTNIDKDNGVDTGSNDKTKCDFGAYAVLDIDGGKSKVLFGDSVQIGDKEYTLVKIGNGLLLQAENSEDSVFFNSDTMDVNGVSVTFLGEGTAEVDSSVLQIEYYNQSGSEETMFASKGKTYKIDIDSKHYVEVTVVDIVKTDKVEYAVLSADVYVESESEQGKFIALSSQQLEVSLDKPGELVVDEETSLQVSLDLLGTGTSYAKAVININGEEKTLPAGETYTDPSLDVSVQVNSVMRGDDGMQYAAVSIIVANDFSIDEVLSDGKVIRLDVGEGRMFRLELVGSESTCE